MNRLKKYAAAICALGLTLNAAAGYISISAEQSLDFGYVIHNDTFEDNIGYPWFAVTQNTGKMDSKVENEQYNILIENPGGTDNSGGDRFDCQFRRRGLHIEKGHSYTLSYDITSDKDGQYYSKIGNLDSILEDGCEAGEVWHGDGHVVIKSSDGTVTQKDIKYKDGWLEYYKIKAGETLNVTATFTAKGTLKVAEWAFHLGGKGEYTENDCFEKGTHLTFDNMMLRDNTSDYGFGYGDAYSFVKYKYTDISVNQLGYISSSKKQAVYAPSDGSDGLSRKTVEGSDTVYFDIKKGDKTVYSGVSAPAVYDEASGNYTYVLDFSDFTDTGNDYRVTVDDKTSYPFSIGEGKDIYKDMAADSMNFFYQLRSGQDIDSKYITVLKYDSQIESAKKDNVSCSNESRLAHEAGSDDDTKAYIQHNMEAINKHDSAYIDKSATQDVSGGWYDGADYKKSVVTGSLAAWTLMNMYERSQAYGDKDKEEFSDKSLLIPENENNIPDLLDEVKTETDFLLKMIVKDGDYKGMMYSDVRDSSGARLAQLPDEDFYNVRVIAPPTQEASYDAAAALAKFAVLYKKYDEEYAQTCLDAAKHAYETSNSIYTDETDSASAVDDEKYLAACELWLLTGDKSYLDDMMKSPFYLDFPEVTDSCTQLFDSDNVEALGTMSLAANRDKLSSAMWSKIASGIIDTADSYIDVQSGQAYGTSVKPVDMKVEKFGEDTQIKGYKPGSNAAVLYNSMMLAQAYDISLDNKFADAALSGMNYLLGTNPLEMSYVTGYGSHHTTFVSNIYWAGQISDLFPVAPSGVVASGPDSSLNDSFLKAFGFIPGQSAPQKNYVDNIEAYSSNGCSTQYNAALAWMTDFASNVKYDMNKDMTYGDMDKNSITDMSDMTYMSLYLMNEKQADINQYRCADVNWDDKVNIADLAHLKQYVMQDEVILGPQ